MPTATSARRPASSPPPTPRGSRSTRTPFAAENAFLPANLRSSDKRHERGDSEAEIRAFLDAGIDGLFIDQPDIAVRLRNAD